jgi:hypothetical protein
METYRNSDSATPTPHDNYMCVDWLRTPASRKECETAV